MTLSKTEIIVINLVLVTYAFVGLFTEYGVNNGGWIIGSMIVLCYVTIALAYTISTVSNLIKKGI